MTDHRDKIVMDGMEFYGYHGLFEEETKLGQPFVVDLILYVDVRTPGLSKNIEDSVHYGEVYERVRDRVEGDPVHLIETLAEEIAEELLADFDLIEAIQVRLKKPTAPLPGIFNYVAIEIYRDRNEGEQ